MKRNEWKETENTHSKFMNNLPLLRILAIMQVLSRDQSISHRRSKIKQTSKNSTKFTIDTQ